MTILRANEHASAAREALIDFLHWHSPARVSEAAMAAGHIESILRDIVEAAWREYPTVVLPTDVFIHYLGERIPAEPPLLTALEAINAADLYLACACTRGDTQAVATFDDRCLRPLDRALLRIGLDAHACADIKQDIRELVLVGNGEPPKIVEFAGRGDLRGWVRVLAVRRALLRQRRAHRERPLEDEDLLHRIAVPAGPELDPAKGVYVREFQRAFDGALRALPDRDRTLLRQHYIDGLTIDELAGLYRVHRATAARFVARTRTRLLEAARAKMMTQLDVQPHALDSILRLIRSQVDISLRALRRRER